MCLKSVTFPPTSHNWAMPSADGWLMGFGMVLYNFFEGGNAEIPNYPTKQPTTKPWAPILPTENHHWKLRLFFLNDPTVSGVSVGPCLRGRVLPPKSSDLEMEQRQLKKPIERSFLNVDNPTMRGLWHGGGLEKTPESYCSDLGSNQERNFWRLNTTQLKWPHWFDPVRIAGSILFLVWKETGVTWSLGYMFEKTISWHHYMPFDSNWI